ncbi:hypothetical protein [Algoriphagus sp. AK58]|uniref:hypothetical protein n=1 Tax=Algoriphagus sp. AK58 TaxID=1406877 RepID=UPI00164F0C8C|nr:hypothetical protein [Algoriphagus sp. AK58]MBC6366061.1 hypothetical protein [Algoriphagus sp. AK58]
MKKIYLTWSGLSLIITLVLSSCVQEIEAPVVNEVPSAVENTVEADLGGENLRKSPNGVAYQEKFSNQLQLIPDFAAGFTPELPFPAWYPGTGVGNATYIGKAYSFINQRAFLSEQGPVTVGAPVTMFHAEKLEALGITNVPDDVSSLTTDGKGNTIYFKNILNVTNPVSETRINFVADVEIIGGTGIFATASGSGKVNGFFNPGDGKGETTLRATILF